MGCTPKISPTCASARLNKCTFFSVYSALFWLCVYIFVGRLLCFAEFFGYSSKIFVFGCNPCVCLCR